MSHSPSPVLLVHNYYQQAGGEDVVFEGEAALLEARGHDVVRYTVHNDAVDAMSRLGVAASTFWNTRVYREVRGLVRRTGARIVHVHNTLPLASPAVYYAARAEGAAVVQTLHNYRLFCLPATFYREGHVCEACLGRLPWRGAWHACYRGDRAASAVLAGMLAAHRALGTWQRQVDAFIALSRFALDKFAEGGLPRDRLFLKPNFLHETPALGSGEGNYALFVGRLTPEKGIATLLKAWRRLGGAISLKILGDGPLADQVRAASITTPGIEWLGFRPPEEVLHLMGEAQMLIFPSEWYETFGRVGMEALATSTPIVAARIGAVQELARDGVTGLLFTPGDAADLAQQVRWLSEHEAERQAMRRAARADFEAHYTAEANYALLLQIYAEARTHRSRTE